MFLNKRDHSHNLLVTLIRIVFIVYSLTATAFDSKLHELKRINENASEMRERGERGTGIVWKQP